MLLIYSALWCRAVHTKGEIKLLGTQSQSRFTGNGHRSCWLTCLPRTCPGHTRRQKYWVTLCLSLCGEVHRRKIKGSKTWLSLTYTGEKSEDDTNNFPDIQDEETYLWFAHSELTGSVWLTQFGINGQCKIYMICWFLCTEISLMFAIVSIYKICASRQDNMWFFFPPTAFQVLCFIIRFFFFKLGKMQEESPSPSRPVAKILCACFYTGGWWYSYSFYFE